MKLSPVHVLIKSYQSIDELEFDVAGFTCVTGPTNIGKSAIMRALSGALLNKPVTNLVRAGSKSCSVRLRSDKWGLLWEKAEKGLNRYTIDNKAEKLENVGQKQPEPVADMGFSNVRIGDRDLYPWYASQWTPVFLLDEGGPTVTQFISEISGLDVLQNAISIGLKGKKKALDEHKSATSEADQFKAKLQKVVRTDDLVVMVGELESQSESIAEYEARVARGKELDSAMTQTASTIDALHGIESISIPQNGMGKEIALSLSMWNRLVKLEEAAKSVIALRGEPVQVPESPDEEHDVWTKIRKYVDVDRLKTSVKKLEPIGKAALPRQLNRSEFDEIKRAKTIVDSIDKLRKSTAILDSDVDLPDDFDSEGLGKTIRAKAILAEMEKSHSDATKLVKNLAQVDSELGGVLEELQNIPSCPTCNRPVVSEHVHGS